jgi:uncharacterized membrane protein
MEAERNREELCPVSKEELRRRVEERMKGTSLEEREKVLVLYEELFDTAESNGKGGNGIMEELGLLETRHTGRNVSAGRIIVAAIGLLFFNIIVVLGPAVAILGLYVSVWAVAVSFVIGAIAALLSIFFWHDGNTLQMMYLSMILGGLGVLMGTVLIPIGKLLYKGAVHYIAFNIKIARGE